MTSSDVTALRPGVVAETAARVTHSYQGSAQRPARIALVCAKFNGAITERLLDGALQALEGAAGGAEVHVAWVPGAFELPLVAARFATSDRADAVVALGAVIRGDTAHFDFVAGQCASGLARVALDTGVPVVFGVLTTENVEQALERSGPGPDNKGHEAAVTAVEMVDLLTQLPARPK
ncbi:MAG TPA: 6,7-dimethyl-8-ribityllumazine synthase [Acidimicrobiales bacterium]|nr:6,7-dimethyl-8-ribityllumazine synthase [Acidimicrobiales bacterium]